MNLIKLVLVLCPAVLSFMLAIASPALANPMAEIAPTPQIRSVQMTQPHSVVETTHPAASDRLLSPGCTCARCTQASTLLQGRLPEL